MIQLEWIFTQCFLNNMGYVFAGVEKLLRENFFPHLFFGKSKTSCTPHRNYNYDASQEMWPGPTKYRDFRGQKISKFTTCKHGADLVSDREKIILHRRSPSGAQGRKL